MKSSIYFDAEDYELLNIVNSVLKSTSKSNYFVKEMHPNGIKSLFLKRETRMAQTVLNFLNSLEFGDEADRISALVSLHNEVITGVSSTFRYNTARVLIQVTKELVNSYGDEERQLRLTHIFRKAINGNPRHVRSLLARYELLEMPEEWNQLSFDDHVHDSYSKGRKSPTHLMTDAWLKGIRALTVIYYDYVDISAANELFKAASVLGIKVSIAIEFKARLHTKMISVIWEPPRVNDIYVLAGFLREEKVAKLMSRGKKVSAYYEKHVFMVLDRFNNDLYKQIGEHYGFELSEIAREKFADYVGKGRSSLYHISELIYKMMSDELKTKDSDSEKIDKLAMIFPENILETWLSPVFWECLNSSLERNEDVPKHFYPETNELIRSLYYIRRRSQITVQLGEMNMADLLELLYDNKGRVTEIQLFNLKDYILNRKQITKEANQLQQAINNQSSIELKRIVQSTIAHYKQLSNCSKERLKKLNHILYNISRLLLYYKFRAIGGAIGSDSTNRSSKVHGIGFIYLETLPRRLQQKIANNKESSSGIIPIHGEIDVSMQYHDDENPSSLLKLVRRIPLLSFAGYTKKLVWKKRVGSYKYTESTGNIASLGKSHPLSQNTDKLKDKKTKYLNTKIFNICKVVTGFILAMGTFMFTQEWWFLALFGAPIWFLITYTRNILQAITAGRGAHPPPLLKLMEYVDWSRVSDSLLYTGLSVPLLELVVRWGVLKEIFNITASTNPVLFFIVISSVNGLYISGHNLIRGLPKEAVVGNLFRSALSVPVALLYSSILLTMYGMTEATLFLILTTSGASIVSKAGSDTVAALIEGYADRKSNVRLRVWDYSSKIKSFFKSYSTLELVMPEEDVVSFVTNTSRDFLVESGTKYTLEKELLIHCLDLMYFYMYLPRSYGVFLNYLQKMSTREREIFLNVQQLLDREEAIKKLFEDGGLGSNFIGARKFYGDNYGLYLKSLNHFR